MGLLFVCYTACPLGGSEFSCYPWVNRQQRKTPVDPGYCENVTRFVRCVRHKQKKLKVPRVQYEATRELLHVAFSKRNFILLW